MNMKHNTKHRSRMFLLDNEFCTKCGEQLRHTRLGNKWCEKCNINLGDD